MNTSADAMTIGTLSRITGVPVKTLRTYEDLGLIYTMGRSEGNYRLFAEEALWCVQVIESLRRMGLTLSEISEIAQTYLSRGDEPLGPRMSEALKAVRRRTEQRIADLHQRLELIGRFEAEFAAELAGDNDFHAIDPRSGTPSPLDSARGGRL